MATDINITADDIMAVLKPEGVPVISGTNTNTTYATDEFNLVVPAAKLISNAGNELLDYTVRPEFNYLATTFNDSYAGSSERMMPTPYSEIFQTSNVLETAYGDPAVESDGTKIYFNIIEGGNIDSGTESSETNPRLIFLGKKGVIRSRSSDYEENFQNIIIANSSQNVKAKDVGKYFPQYVMISLAGLDIAPQPIHMETSYPGNLLNKCLNTDGALAHLMVDFVVNRHNVKEGQNDLQMPEFGYNEIQVNTINQQNTNTILRSWKFWNVSQVSESENVIIQDTILSNFQTNFVLDDFLECINPINDDEYNATRSDIQDSLSDKVNQMKSYAVESQITSLPTYPTELLFYKVEKYDGNGLIQTFWTTVLSIAGSSFDFIDTQVKVGKEYTYRCYGYFLHFINSGQDARLTEVPLFSQSFKIEQPSLPRPQVQFVNVKDSKNQIRIFLNQSANSEDGEFYGLNQGEKEAFISRHQMYDITQEKKKFVYETDVGRYQIYKMLDQPIMGANNDDPYANIVPNSTLYEINGTFGSTAGHFTDTLAPFKKYYYMVRAVNNYGYYSNPSPIYEVELTKDADETFMKVNVVGFAKPNMDKYLLSKTMMRLLQIVPAPGQTVFYPEGDIQTSQTAIRNSDDQHIVGFRNSNGEIVEVGYVADGETVYTIDQNILYGDGLTFDEYINVNGVAPLYETQEITSLSEYGPNNEIPTLGTAQEKIWTTKDSSGNIKVEGKRFKIRLVSKDSGRKIDFNLRFILNKNYNTNWPN